MKTDQEQLAIYQAGWVAMRWLTQHAKVNCLPCADYRLAIQRGRRASQEVGRRCPIARAMHRDYMAVEQLRLELADRFECFLIDPSRPDILCDGAVEWAFVERSRRDNTLIGFTIGCHRHATFAEARAIVTGGTGTFTIEKVEDVVREGADKMR